MRMLESIRRYYRARKRARLIRDARQLFYLDLCSLYESIPFVLFASHDKEERDKVMRRLTARAMVRYQKRCKEIDQEWGDPCSS